MAWGFDDIPRLDGKIAIVTGASSGIGLYATEHFAGAGAKVILAVRNVEKGERVAEEIRKRLAEKKDVGQLEVMELDVSKMASIRNFGSKFSRDHSQLHILMNNAGVMMIPYEATEEGYEMQYATNYLGEFMLTGLLMKLLEKTKGSRVVNVASMAHKRAHDVDYDMMSGKKKDGYDRAKVYAETKLANLLFTFELARRLKAANKDVLVVAAHPGWSRTSLQSRATTWWFPIINFAFRPFASQSSEHGSMPLLMAAVDENAEPGDYYGPDGPMELKGRPKKVTPSDDAKDEDKAKKLWHHTETLLNMKYSF